MNLRPDKILTEGNDTLYCWGTEKAKEIAKRVVNESYLDSLVDNRNLKIATLDSITVLKDKVILTYLDEVGNHELIIKNKDKIILNLKEIVDIKDNEIKKHKKHKWFLGALSVAITILAIL